MKKTLTHALLYALTGVGVFLLLYAQSASALTLKSQLVNSSPVCNPNPCLDNTANAPKFRIGTGVNATTTTLFLTLSSSSGANQTFGIREYATSSYSTLLNVYTFSAIVGVGNTPQVVFATSTGVYLRSDRYYVISYESGDNNVDIWGLDGGDCSGNVGCTGAWYYALTNGTDPNINWEAITINPPIDFSAIQFIATGTSLFSNGTSTLEAIAANCDDSGNVFSRGLCYAGTYLFVPNPSILNGYSTLANETMPSKFPFSWIYGVKDTVDDLQATTTSNFITVGVNFMPIDPASTTPFGSFLPNFTAVSSSTVQRYMPAGFLSTMLALMRAVIWIVFATYLFYDVRNRWTHHTV